MGWLVHGIFVAFPTLDHELRGIGLGPHDAHRVDGLDLGQIAHNPLWMQGIAFACESLREIGIALPIRILVPVVRREEPASGVPSLRVKPQCDRGNP